MTAFGNPSGTLDNAWSELASQSLPSLAAAVASTSTSTTASSYSPFQQVNSSLSQQQRLNRNLSEIQAASQSTQSLLQQQQRQQHPRGVGAGSSSSNSNNNTAGAQALLGGYYYRPSMMMTTTTTLADDTTMRDDQDDFQQMNQHPTLSTSSLEDTLAVYEQQLILQILNDTSAATRLKTDTLIEKQLQRAWERERDTWLCEQVGTRTLGGSSSGGTGNSTGGGVLATIASPQQNMLVAASPLPRGGGGGTSMSTALQSLSFPDTTNNTVFETTTLDPALVQAHLELVQQMDERHARLTSVQPFLRILAAHPTTKVAVDAGYRSAWQLVSHLLQMPPPPSASGGGGGPNPMDCARASLAHLCQSFRQLVLDQLRRTNSSQYGGNNQQQQPYANDMANQCAAYAHLVLAPRRTDGTSNNAAADDDDDDAATTWATLYYCLRCGDAVAAAHVASRATATTSTSNILDHHDVAVPNGALQRLLAAWAQAQQDVPSVWQFTTTTSSSSQQQQQRLLVLPRLSANDRRAVAEQANRLMSTNGSTTTSSASSLHIPYQVGVYALASALMQPPSDDAVPGMNTIEDYLTFALTKAMLASSSSSDINFTTTASSANSSNNPVEELAQVGRVIAEQFGPAHFADHAGGGGGGESGGWSFALPLLLTQQYAKALAFLQSRGGAVGLLQAAHLGLVLVTACGVPLVNLTTTTTLQQDEGDSKAFIASLLSAYANQLLAEPAMTTTGSTGGVGGATAALEYLVRIPHKPRAAKEVAALIAKTRGETTAVLVGTVNSQGIRQGGADVLDKYFNNPQDVSSILVDAAEQLLRSSGSISRDGAQQHRDKDKTGMAAMCYLLAGRHASVLQLLSQLLSPPDRPDEDRDYWMAQTESFFAHYVDKPTAVLQVLEQNEHNKSVVKTSRVMVQLNKFFAWIRTGQTVKAWEVAEQLDLLPLTQLDLARKETEFRGLDPLVQAALPSLLLGAVNVLYGEHRRIKQDAAAAAQYRHHHQVGEGGGVARERMRELQDKARILVTYAGLVGMGSGQRETLSRLEALMI